MSLTPSENPTTSSSSTVQLERLKSTLTARWDEFDKALPALKAIDAKYNNIKDAYNALSNQLAQVRDDEALRNNAQIKTSIDTFLIQTARHLSDTQRDRQYDKLVMNVQSDLSNLNTEIYGSARDTSNPTASEAPQDVVAGVTTAMAATVTESVDAVTTEIEEAKKNPIKKFAEWKGWTPESIGSSVKNLMAEKKSGGFSGIFTGIKLMFWGLLVRYGDIDIASQFTPEEIAAMDPAMRERLGIPVAAMAPVTPEKPVEKPSTYVLSTEVFLAFGRNRETLRSNSIADAKLLLQNPDINKISLDVLRKGYTGDGKSFDIARLPQDAQNLLKTKSGLSIDKLVAGLTIISSIFFSERNTIQKEVSKTLLAGGSSQTIRASIDSGYKSLRKFSPLTQIDLDNPQAMMSEAIGNLVPRVDSEGKLQGEIAEEASSVFGAETAKFVFGTNRDIPVPQDIAGVERFLATPNEAIPKKPEDTQKLRELLIYGVSLRQQIAQDSGLHLGFGQEVSSALINSFTLSDLAMLRLFLDGKTQTTQMSPIQHGFFVMQIAGMIGQTDKQVLLGKYSQTIIDALAGKATDTSKLPPSVRQFFRDIAGYGLTKTGDVIGDTLLVAGGMASKNPLAALAIIATAIFGPWFTKRTAIVGPFKK